MSLHLRSRADLSELATLDRDKILGVLGSFDERRLDERELARRVAELLDPVRVPELRETESEPAAEAVAQSVADACGAEPPEAPRVLSAEARRLAEDALVHRFTFYGETLDLPPRIDWDDNPGTAHWGHDLNRFTYLTPLTDAYSATGDERYSRKAVDLILAWIGACDVGRCFGGTPYMFGSYLNNAIHCAAWARCVRALLPRRQIAPRDLLLILKSLHDQMAYLEVVTNGHHGNWPTIGCRGILQVLAQLPVFRRTDRLIDYSVGTLAAQIDEQVLPDGVQDELTPHYHAVVVENLVASVESLRALGRSLERRTLAALGRMLRYGQQTIVPDRSAQVAFNDSDPEAVPDIAARLRALGLADMLAPEETLGSEIFPYAGVVFLRQAPAEGDLYLAFDGGPFGRSHQHEDKLGFWLHAYGRNLIVDPGRHLYDHSERSYFDYLRSTRAHSTLLIDGEGQHSRGRPDTWIAAEPTGVAFRVGEREVRASAAYDLGYGPRNAIAAVHWREVVFVRQSFWILFDRVTGDGEHRIESRFQFAPGELTLQDTRAATCFEDANLLLWSATAWDEVHVETGSENPRGGWYSPSYGRIQPAPALCLTATRRLPFLTATLLLPYAGRRVPEVELSFHGGAATVRIADRDPVVVVPSIES